MAHNYCTFVPSKGKNLFKELKKQFGYKVARSVFLRAINPEFINDYSKTLKLDSEGVPTFTSIINNPYMKDFIGEAKILEGLNKNYPPVEDTGNNYRNLLESAYQFNTANPQREDFVATVEYTEEGTIKVVIQPKTQQATERFREQYSTQKLNENLASIFQPLGITVGKLNDVETKAGRIGLTDFSIARGIATSCVSMIKIADNMEGEKALTEEFSHLIVGVFRNEPLVDRAVNILANNLEALKEILGDDFEDTMEFYNGDTEMVAEEAVGHILQRNLSSNTKKANTPTPSLFKRMVDWVVRQFKGYNIKDVQDAIDRVDSLMSSLANDVLSGTRKITQEDIKASQRDARFNALSDKIERNIEILKNAAKVEVKRYKISKDSSGKAASESKVKEILKYTKEDADTVEGIFKYAKDALNQLRSLEITLQNIDTLPPNTKFGILRNVRMYVQSYGTFIEALNNAAIDDEQDEDNMFLKDVEVDGNTISIQEVLNELNKLTKNLNLRYLKIATPAFVEFLKPFLGNEIIVPFGKKAGTKITAESLIEEAQEDISFMDRWLDSMGDSSDTLLQLFDAAVKAAKDTARLDTIKDIRTIQALIEKSERLGITDFEWMFETDLEGNKTGNYISKINYGQFEKDLQELEDYLKEKYGENPTGDEVNKKLRERDEWLRTNSVSIFGTPQPNPKKYRNNAYYNLTDSQKEILDDFTNIKSKYDKKFPKGTARRNRAIQIRKAGSQRILESITSPETLFENIKESITSAIFVKEDDDQLFGSEGIERGLTDFAGNEFMTLPILYTTKLKNPNELSTDVMGSLMAYAYMANQYEQMDKIIDPLEVGRTLVDSNVRKVRKTSGGKQMVERINALGVTTINSMYATKTNIEKKLDDFFASQVYGKYLSEGKTVDIAGNKINTNKFTSLILKGSSLAQLGLNWLANLANATTGLAMQNIEAAAGQFFGVKELAKADAAYASNIIPLIAELNSRIKTNKLSLVFELFNIKQDYTSKIKRVQKKNWLQRLFGAEIAFIGQNAGDHWLYGRTAIAMMIKERVKLNGKEMSLWDALQVEDSEESATIKKLNAESITDLEGNPFNFAKFSRKIASVNQGLFGIYNDEDANAANRVAMGRLLQQYRKWMKVQYNKRFQAGQTNLATDTWQEGYYRTFGRILNQLVRGQLQLGTIKDELTLEERQNIRRAITELVQFFAVWAVANWIEWPDDKNRPWAMKLAEYAAKRLAHELGGLTPSTVMPQELLKTVKNPIPSTSAIQNLFTLVNSVIDPTDWVDEIERGPYKGMSTLEKNIIKSPLPVFPQIMQINKFTKDLDNSINYYARPSAY